MIGLFQGPKAIRFIFMKSFDHLFKKVFYAYRDNAIKGLE